MTKQSELIKIINNNIPVDYHYELFSMFVDLYNLINNKDELVFDSGIYKKSLKNNKKLKKTFISISKDLKSLNYEEKSEILELFDIKIKRMINTEKYSEAKYYSSMRKYYIDNCI